MPRLLFTKTGEAVWMSHLDLMRLFQRAFKRAGLPLKHTQGYNPRPSVSIALPLSVGVESVCELLDFDLDGESVSCQQITDLLNGALVPGIRVLETIDNGRKIKELALLSCSIILEYDQGVPEDAVEKKGKNGPTQQDIIPMIRNLRVEVRDVNSLILHATICCQNPTLNPAQLVSAIQTYLPEYTPDFSKCRRLEVFDTNEQIFR